MYCNFSHVRRKHDRDSKMTKAYEVDMKMKMTMKSIKFLVETNDQTKGWEKGPNVIGHVTPQPQQAAVIEAAQRRRSRLFPPDFHFPHSLNHTLPAKTHTPLLIYYPPFAPLAHPCSPSFHTPIQILLYYLILVNLDRSIWPPFRIACSTRLRSSTRR